MGGPGPAVEGRGGQRALAASCLGPAHSCSQVVSGMLHFSQFRGCILSGLPPLHDCEKLLEPPMDCRLAGNCCQEVYGFTNAI